MELPDTRRAWGLAEVLHLSWPVSLTMLNSTLMRFVDGWIVSWTGPEVVAAQFVGGITSFVPESIGLGLILVVNTYVSQNFGARRLRRCGLYAWAGILVALAISLLLAPLALLARPVFAWFFDEHGPHILAMETMYFRYMLLSMFLTLGARALAQFFYGIHRPRIVLAASLIANAFNIVGDYALVLGHFGLPRMGLQGAAIATVSSWGLLMAILLGVFLAPRLHRRYGTRRLRAVRFHHVTDLLRIGWPAAVQFGNDILTWAVLMSKLVGMFGPAHLTATGICMRYMSLSFMPTVGLGAATTALVGRYIAEGRADLARRRAHAALLVAMAYMGTCGLVFLLFRRELVGFFLARSAHVMDAQVSPSQVLEIGATVMVCAALFQLFDAVGIIFMGALRGAGDTLRPMLMTVASNWVLAIGGGVAMVVFAPFLKSIGPWAAGSVFVVVLGLLLAWRFESGAWRRIDLLGRNESA